MEKILHTQVLAETTKFRIEGVDIDFGNGNTHQFERVQFQGSGKGIMIIALERGLNNSLSDSFVYLIEHFMVGSEERELTLPGGHRESHHTLTQAANQELQEEIGIISQKITSLITITSSGYVCGTTTFCLAEGLSSSQLEGDEYEDIIVHKVLYPTVLDMISKGEITDVRAIAGLLYAYSLG